VKTTDERELKLEAGPRFRLPDLPGERLERRVLTSVYLDTADHRLATSGVTLRRRWEAGRARWQLKLPHGEARLELEVPDPAARGGRRGTRRGGMEPPPELADLVTAYSRGTTLVPVATLRTRRDGTVVRDAHGPVAEVVLDSVDVLDGHAAVKRFREVEIELTGGDERALSQIAETVRKAGATDGDGRPKLLRVLGIEPVAPAEQAEDSASTPERLRAMIEFQLGSIVAHDAGTRRGEDPEDLHQMRVACRRTRAFLREARPMLDPDWAEPLRAELEWLGDELGAVRDLDVLRQHLGDQIASLDPSDAQGGARLLRALESERARARSGLLAAIRSDRYLKLLAALDEAARQPHVTDPNVTLEDIGRDAFKRLRRAVNALPDEPSDEELHDIRIKAKHARYAAELAEPAVGKSARLFIERAKDFQDLLGDLHDAVVARERIRELGRRARGAAMAFVSGRLLERQVTRREEILGRFSKRWRKLRKWGRKTWQ